ncbi:MAG: hypothetical protein WC788_00025 [Candidatus Paceibacterota bacterium]|jgi:hypothetical protein
MFQGIDRFTTLVAEMSEFFNEPEVKAARTQQEFMGVVERRIAEMEKANVPEVE